MKRGAYGLSPATDRHWMGPTRSAESPMDHTGMTPPRSLTPSSSVCPGAAVSTDVGARESGSLMVKIPRRVFVSPIRWTRESTMGNRT
jgi:hypothetical protein